MLDVNDNAPKIDVPQSCVSISEFHDIRENIVTVKVKDADNPLTPNGRVVLRISEGNEQGKFLSYNNKMQHTFCYTPNFHSK